MKKISIAIALFATVVANAQTDLARLMVEAEKGDLKAAEVLTTALNADTPCDSTGLYADHVEDYIGNFSYPVHLTWAEHRGAFFGIAGVGQNFDGNNSFGGGLTGGYVANHWFGSITGTASNGYPDKTSMRQAQFRQYDAMGRLGWIPDFLQFNNHHDWFAIYGEFSYKYCRDYQEDGGTYKDVSTDATGTTTTTTTIFNSLDNRASTMGWAGGAMYAHEFWGTPARVYVAVDYGRQQNLTFMRGMWHNRFKVEIGFTLTLRKVHKNHKAMNTLGINQSQLPKMW